MLNKIITNTQKMKTDSSAFTPMQNHAMFLLGNVPIVCVLCETLNVADFINIYLVMFP